MKTGTRTLGPASLKLSYSQLVDANLRGGLREVSKVSTEPGKRRQGAATALLRAICTEADAAGIILMLVPEPFGAEGMDAQQLTHWYARCFYFETLDDGPAMIRLPYRVAIRREHFEGAFSG